MARSYVRAVWMAAAVAGAAALVLPACTSEFSTCVARRSCPISGSGGSGEAESSQGGDAGESGSSGHGAGASGASAGQPAAGDGGAGGSIDDAGAGGASGAAPDDNVAPTILSITPVNGATKLTPGSDIIVITFSEPMDKTSAQKAFAPSGDAPVPTFTWNAGGTELSINPNLGYPAATDPTAAAAPFKFSVTTVARDLAGNRLAAEVNWQFTLLREITQTLLVVREGAWIDGNTILATFSGAGDDAINREERGFIAADISSLPPGIEAFESATLHTSVFQIFGDPFGSLGNMLIQSVSFSPPASQGVFDAPALQDLGVLITATGHNAVGDPVSKDVLAAVKDDYQNRSARNNLSQYRLIFPSAPNGNSTRDLASVVGTNEGSALTVKYLFP